jgi:hypothetical protein
VPRLKAYIGYGLSSLLMALLVLDAFDQRLLGYEYHPPLELYGLLATIVAGLFTSEVMRRGNNGNGGTPPTPGTYPPPPPPTGPGGGSWPPQMK